MQGLHVTPGPFHCCLSFSVKREKLKGIASKWCGVAIGVIIGVVWMGSHM